MLLSRNIDFLVIYFEVILVICILGYWIKNKYLKIKVIIVIMRFIFMIFFIFNLSFFINNFFNSIFFLVFGIVIIFRRFFDYLK